MSNRYYLTAGRIINDVAVDFGLEEVTDPVSSTDKQFVQLQRQLDIAIEELAEVHKWSQFTREHTFVTDSATYADGQYPLPTDFHYMIPQTHWNRTDNLPVGGSMSPQDWQWLLGRDLVSSTIYASFREKEGIMAMWPPPPTDGLTIAYEYQSTNWVRNAADDANLQRVESTGDTVLLPPPLIRGYLKAKYQSSKGFQSMEANEAVALWLNTSGSQERAAPILNVGGRSSRFPYLDPRRNLPDTGYGS